MFHLLLIFIKPSFKKGTQKERFGPSSVEDYYFQSLFLLQILLLRVKEESTVGYGFGFNPEPFYRFRKSVLQSSHGPQGRGAYQVSCTFLPQGPARTVTVTPPTLSQ